MALNMQFYHVHLRVAKELEEIIGQEWVAVGKNCRLHGMEYDQRALDLSLREHPGRI